MLSPPTLRRVLIGAGVLALLLGLPQPALAHGEVTGVQDVIQDYGVLLFLSATVLIGAGVLAWVTVSTQPDEEEAAEEEPDPLDPPAEPQEPGQPEKPDGAVAPDIPEGSRGSR